MCVVPDVPLSSNQLWCEAKVRISRGNPTDIAKGQCSMARSLLSMSVEEEEILAAAPVPSTGDSSQDASEPVIPSAAAAPAISRHALEQYILTDNEMGQLNYPLPLQCSGEGVRDECEGEVDEPTHKRRRKEDDPLDGTDGFVTTGQDDVAPSSQDISESPPPGWPTKQQAKEILSLFKPMRIPSLPVKTTSTINSIGGDGTNVDEGVLVDHTVLCYQTVDHEANCPSTGTTVAQNLWPITATGAASDRRRVAQLPRYADPITSCPHIDNIASSSKTGTITSPSRYHVFGLDCEMVATTAGSQVCKVTLVDEYGIVVLDSYIQPSSPITDYLTEYSGVTEKHLERVNTSLAQLQVVLLRLLHKDRSILVGHSLENDLFALGIMHDKCVDTAALFPHPKGLPYRYRLKSLAAEYLHIQIQRSEGVNGAGHDSLEDARTAVRLAMLKAEKGPSYGVKAVVPADDGRDIVEHIEPRVPTVANAFDKHMSRYLLNSGGKEVVNTPASMVMFFTNDLRHKVLKHCALPSAPVYAEHTHVRNLTAPYMANTTLNKHVSSTGVRWSMETGAGADADAGVTPKQITVVDFVYTDREGTRDWLMELLQLLRENNSSGEQGYEAEGRGVTNSSTSLASAVAGTNTLVVVSCQGCTEAVRGLQKKKRQCHRNAGRSFSSIIWSRDDEKELKELCTLGNIAHVGMCVV